MSQQVKCDDIGMALMVPFICLGFVSKRTEDSEDHLFVSNQETHGRSSSLLGSLLEGLPSYPKDPTPLIPFARLSPLDCVEGAGFVQTNPSKREMRNGVCPCEGRKGESQGQGQDSEGRCPGTE